MAKNKKVNTNKTTSSQTISDILDTKEDIVLNEINTIKEVEEDFNIFTPDADNSEDRVMIKFLTSFWSNRKGDEVVVSRKLLSAISKKRYKII